MGTRGGSFPWMEASARRLCDISACTAAYHWRVNISLRGPHLGKLTFKRGTSLVRGAILEAQPCSSILHTYSSQVLAFALHFRSLFKILYSAGPDPCLERHFSPSVLDPYRIHTPCPLLPRFVSFISLLSTMSDETSLAIKAFFPPFIPFLLSSEISQFFLLASSDQARRLIFASHCQGLLSPPPKTSHSPFQPLLRGPVIPLSTVPSLAVKALIHREQIVFDPASQTHLSNTAIEGIGKVIAHSGSRH